jgi:hypothetical protein
MLCCYLAVIVSAWSSSAEDKLFHVEQFWVRAKMGLQQPSQQNVPRGTIFEDTAKLQAFSILSTANF